MATIDTYLENIKNKTYGEDVRDAIHDGIQQCYTDATDVVKVSDTPPTSENTKIWIKPVNEDMSVPTWEEHEELADEVSDLKAAIKQTNENSYFHKSDFREIAILDKGGLVNSAGRITVDSNNKWVFTHGGTESAYVYAGSKFTVKVGYILNYALWEQPVSSSVDQQYRYAIGLNLTGGSIVNIDKDGYFVCSVKKADDSDLPADVDLEEFIQNAIEMDICYSTLKKAQLCTRISLNARFVAGKYINTNISVGSVVDISGVANSGFQYIIQPCKKYDKFVLSGTGGSNPRLYAFTDESYGLISKSGANLTKTDFVVTADNDGYLIVNATIASSSSLILERIGSYVDSELVLSGTAADAKAVGDHLKSLDEINLRRQNTFDLSDLFVENRYIKLDVGIGNEVDLEGVSLTGWHYTVQKCKKGDVFYITGTGGDASRIFGFIDSSNILQSVSGVNAVYANRQIEAPLNGFIIVNANASQAYGLTAVRDSVDIDESFTYRGTAADAKAVGDFIKSQNHRVITDPHDIRWAFGYHTSTGWIERNNTAMTLELPIHVQSAKLIPDSSIDINSRYVDDKTSTASYLTWGQTERIFSEPGMLRFSVKYHDGSPCDDISILSHLTVIIDMLNEDYVDVDYKPLSIMLCHPPASNYVGRHVDSTGLVQGSTYADSLAKWRELPALAPGYVTETDLGEMTTGQPHTYKYTLIPPNEKVSGMSLPHIFIVTSQHGQEKSATYGLNYLIRDMIDHAMEDPVLFYLRNYVRFTILPMASPFSWEDSLNGNGSRWNANNVNLNRNYSTSRWHDFDNDESYLTPRAYNARGDAPFSEPETQRIRDNIISAGDVSFVIDLHTNGEDTKNTGEIAYCTYIVDGREIHQRAMEAGDEWIGGLKVHMDTLYGTNLGYVHYGHAVKSSEIPNLTLRDWAYESLRVLATTLEVPCGSRSGYLGPNLAKYTPDLIKLCGEEIGNFICKTLYQISKCV